MKEMTECFLNFWTAFGVPPSNYLSPNWSAEELSDET